MCGGRGCAGVDGRAEDLAGDEHGLHGVVLADASGHEEGFDPGDDHRDAGPGEEEIEEAQSVAAEVEVVDPETAEEDSEEDADDLVFAGAFVFGVEPAALLVVHVDGVDGVCGVHGVSSRTNTCQVIRVRTAGGSRVSCSYDLFGRCCREVYDPNGRNLQEILQGVEFSQLARARQQPTGDRESE